MKNGVKIESKEEAKETVMSIRENSEQVNLLKKDIPRNSEYHLQL